jgi:hypothetical protein
MNRMFDAFWRALSDSFRPRVLLLSLAPLAVMLLLVLGTGFSLGEAILAWARGWVGDAGWLNWSLGWLDPTMAADVRAVLAPLLVVALVTPLITIGALLLVALLMTPAMLRLVAGRRFPGLQRRGGGVAGWLGAAGFSLGTTVLAFGALLLSMPLWLVPPLILVLPPLIFGWLSYRVTSYDVLADHASAEERRALMRRHRGTLLAMGVITGYLGTAPAVVWASGLLFAALFWLLVPLAIWIYTWVFAFSGLWFAHFCLAALQAEREAEAPPPAVPPPAEPPLLPPAPLAATPQERPRA